MQCQQLQSEVLSAINPNNAQGRILDFIAGMTDSYAAEMARQMSGYSESH